MPFYLAQRDADQHVRLLHYLSDTYISNNVRTAAHLDFMWDLFRHRIKWSTVSVAARIDWTAAYAYRRFINWRSFILHRTVPLTAAQAAQIRAELERVRDLFLGNEQIAAQYYSDEFCRELPTMVNWRLAVKMAGVSQDAILAAADHIPIKWLIENHRVDMQVVQRYGARMDWQELCNWEVPIDILRAYKDRMQWKKIVKHTKLPPDLIKYAMLRVPAAQIAADQQLGYQLIVDFVDVLPMETVSQSQQLTPAEIFELSSILHAKHLATNRYTQQFFIHSGGSLYYLIIGDDDEQQIRGRTVHSEPLAPRRTADSCVVQLARRLG